MDCPGSFPCSQGGNNPDLKSGQEVDPDKARFIMSRQGDETSEIPDFYKQVVELVIWLSPVEHPQKLQFTLGMSQSL